MTKILYFEGAGTIPRGEIGNCRIRTAFHLDDGRAVYLDIFGYNSAYKNGTAVAMGFVEHCALIKENAPYPNAEGSKFPYSKAGVLRYVNSLGSSFDGIQVLHSLAGYSPLREFPGKYDTYEFGDVFQPNRGNVVRALAIKQYFEALEKTAGIAYPTCSLWNDAHDKGMLHLLRHFPDCTRHWTIRCDTDEWLDTMQECMLDKD